MLRVQPRLLRLFSSAAAIGPIPGRALAGYRLAHAQLLTAFLFPNHFVLLFLHRKSMEHRTNQGECALCLSLKSTVERILGRLVQKGADNTRWVYYGASLR